MCQCQSYALHLQASCQSHHHYSQACHLSYSCSLPHHHDSQACHLSYSCSLPHHHHSSQACHLSYSCSLPHHSSQACHLPYFCSLPHHHSRQACHLSYSCSCSHYSQACYLSYSCSLPHYGQACHLSYSCSLPHHHSCQACHLSYSCSHYGQACHLTCPTPAPCPTTTAKPATSPAGPPPTDGELEMCAISTKDKACSSHNVTCSCLLAMIANPMGGFQAVLDGLSVARSIVIRGQSNAKAKRLVVNLDARDANGKNATAALHLNMDLESQTFTLNSGVDRKWGDKQTGDLPRERPFGAGLPFKIVIKWALSTWTSTTSSSWTSQVLNLILGASIGWRCGK
nr:uncharacterized protein LOC125994724 isoform X1 [Syngnathus scovelli]